MCFCHIKCSYFVSDFYFQRMTLKATLYFYLFIYFGVYRQISQGDIMEQGSLSVPLVL